MKEFTLGKPQGSKPHRSRETIFLYHKDGTPFDLESLTVPGGVLDLSDLDHDQAIAWAEGPSLAVRDDGGLALTNGKFVVGDADDPTVTLTSTDSLAGVWAEGPTAYAGFSNVGQFDSVVLLGSDPVFTEALPGDVEARWQLNGDGSMHWSNGADSAGTHLASPSWGGLSLNASGIDAETAESGLYLNDHTFSLAYDSDNNLFMSPSQVTMYGTAWADADTQQSVNIGFSPLESFYASAAPIGNFHGGVLMARQRYAGVGVVGHGPSMHIDFDGTLRWGDGLTGWPDAPFDTEVAREPDGGLRLTGGNFVAGAPEDPTVTLSIDHTQASVYAEGPVAYAGFGDDGIIWLADADGGVGSIYPQGFMDFHGPAGAYSIEARPFGADFSGDLHFHNAGEGPVVRSPDGNLHKLKVNNDGTFASEVVS